MARHRGGVAAARAPPPPPPPAFPLLDLPSAALLLVMEQLDPLSRRAARATNQRLREVANSAETRIHLGMSPQEFLMCVLFALSNP